MDFALTIVVNYILLGFLCALPGSIWLMLINPAGLFKELGKKIVKNWENLDQEMENSYWVKFWTCPICWALRTSIIVGGILLYTGTPLFLIGVTILSAYYISDKL